MSLFERVDPDLLNGALTIVKTLEDKGHQAYFAGGAVRDLILERPVSDIDVATSAPPQEIEQLFAHTVPVGREFGVMVVVINGVNYEVATFRTEAGYADGRHPSSVRFASAREDVMRRDFTVNALFLNPLSEEVIDWVEGKADLKRRIIRTVGAPAQRFEEDKLRVLRAVRLACQLDFQIEAETEREVRRRAAELTRVSAERIRDELLKILTGPDPARGLDLLLESGILQVILPEVAAMKGVEQPPEFHPEGDVFTHTRLMLELAEAPDDILALAILLHDVGKPTTFSVRDRIRFDRHADVGAGLAETIGRRLRLSNEQIEEIVDLVKDHLRFIHVQQMRESRLKRFLRKENFHRHLELHRLDCLASHGDLSSYEFCRGKLAEITREQMRPAPLLDGHDLIALGFKPGPIFSEILEAVEDLQLEGSLHSREEALAWVKANYPSGAEKPS